MNSTFPSQELSRALGKRSGFSLLELLTVIAMMAVLTTLIAPAFNSLGKSNLLDAEGNRFVNLVNYAGQNSISKNAMTALIVIAPETPGAYKASALFEYTPEALDWKQLSPWETVKDGVVLDPATFSTFSDSGTQPQPAFPVLRYRGAAVNSYKYLIFLPNRSLLQNTSAQLKLAEGNFPPGASLPTYTHRASDGTPANYYGVTVLGPTGRPKIDRP